MKKRIRELIRLYTYQEAAELIGCDPDTIRVHGRGFPIIKRSKPHGIPANVLDPIVKTRLIAAWPSCAGAFSVGLV
jgi:hypothetical protein